MDVSKDELEEILVWVSDCRSAIRCSAVCKRWQAVINSAGFRSRFNRRHSDEVVQFTHVLRLRSSILHVKMTSEWLEFSAMGEKMIMGACCGELLAFQLSQYNVSVINPLTKQWRLLPQHPDRYLITEADFGLIRLQHCGHFKLVMVTGFHKMETIKTSVFCSESCRWTDSFLTLPDANTWVEYHKILAWSLQAGHPCLEARS